MLGESIQSNNHYFTLAKVTGSGNGNQSMLVEMLE